MLLKLLFVFILINIALSDIIIEALPAKNVTDTSAVISGKTNIQLINQGKFRSITYNNGSYDTPNGTFAAINCYFEYDFSEYTTEMLPCVPSIEYKLDGLHPGYAYKYHLTVQIETMCINSEGIYTITNTSRNIPHLNSRSYSSQDYIQVRTIEPRAITNMSVVLRGITNMKLLDMNSTEYSTNIPVKCYFEYGNVLNIYGQTSPMVKCAPLVEIKVNNLLPDRPYKYRFIMQIGELEINALGLYFYTKK